MSYFPALSGSVELPNENSWKAVSNGREVVHRSFVSQSVTNW